MLVELGDAGLAGFTISMFLYVNLFFEKSVISMSRSRCSGPSNRSRSPFVGRLTMTGSVAGLSGEYINSSFPKVCGSALSLVTIS